MNFGLIKSLITSCMLLGVLGTMANNNVWSVNCGQVRTTEANDHFICNGEIDGRGGDDELNGGRGNDVLDGGPGNDVLDGRRGNDVLDGGPGNDELTGGPGADRFFCGNGIDRATDYSSQQGDHRSGCETT